jgi:hypothetical protein
MVILRQSTVCSPRYSSDRGSISSDGGAASLDFLGVHLTQESFEGVVCLRFFAN